MKMKWGQGGYQRNREKKWESGGGWTGKTIRKEEWEGVNKGKKGEEYEVGVVDKNPVNDRLSVH